MVREIPLTQGQVAVVDDEDYERVSAFKWTAMRAHGITERWYAVRSKNSRLVYLHRFIMGSPSGTLIDHRNRDGLDCRRANLRNASPSQNVANQAKWKQGATSRFKGVSRSSHPSSPRPWMAMIRCGGKTNYLGLFATEEEAARAYDEGAPDAFGAFAYLNFPEASRC